MAFKLALFLITLLLSGGAAFAHPKNMSDVLFDRNYVVRWANDHTKSLKSGKEMQLLLDNSSGSGFGSKDKYLFGHITMKIKLVPNDSAGTVAAFYMSSENANHDELDFEFLGNRSGQPYTVQTNVFAKGIGQREQRISLWFDPTIAFHAYSLVWNQKQITFYVDGVPIRIYRNNEAMGIPYPNSQPMGVYSSLWNGDDWATRGGLEKIDWQKAPFVANYRGFNIDTCAGCTQKKLGKKWWWNQAFYETTDQETSNKLSMVKQNFMIYDYCTDAARFPTTPPECALNR